MPLEYLPLEYLLIACVAFGLGIYLLYALLFPEKF